MKGLTLFMSMLGASSSSLFDDFEVTTSDMMRTSITIMIVMVVIGFVIIPLGTLMIGVYNALIRTKNEVEESYASMDIYLKKRYDLIPNLVRVVKAYAKHEKETLTQVVEARKKAMNENDAQKAVKEENVLSRSLTNLFALSENYPELKADKQFLALQQRLLSVEDEIADARNEYNEAVKAYNTIIESFPSNLFAKMFHHTKREMFEVENMSERNNVQIDL